MQITNSNQRGAIWIFIASIAPFFLPAISFESAIFALVSPIPLFVLTLKNRLGVSLLALASNTVLVALIAPRNEALAALALWMTVGVFFPYLIRKLGRIKASFVLSLLLAVSLIFGTLSYFAHKSGSDVIAYTKSEISSLIDTLSTYPDNPLKPAIEEHGRDAVQKQIVTELPSGIVIGLIMTLWINLLFASRLIPHFLSKGFWSNYRNPEWLVWPTLVFAALFSFTDHALYYIGLNGMKILIVFYGFQGLSILSHLLNRYKIGGLGRALIFSIAVFVVMPVVLSLGFFDLWFDFRKKLSQQ